MGDKTGIEWTDATWSPATGCTKVSPGCDHCYADGIAHRFTGTKAYPMGFVPTLRPERLDQPLRWTRPRRIFVCSMADLFHDAVPDTYIIQVFAIMTLAERHTFQVLTKRHARMRSLLRSVDFWRSVRYAASDRVGHDDVVVGPALPNVWLGVSAENQQWADIRIPALLDTPAVVRWVSAEPLLGPIDLRRLPSAASANRFAADRRRLDWVVVGGESGRGARPMHPDWVRTIRDQCDTADVAFLFKQWGEYAPTDGRDGIRLGDVCLSEDGDRYDVGPDYVCAHNESDGTWLRRVGKKAAGRELDGRLHDGYPTELQR